MRILLVADMRSPHSIGWVHGLTRIGANPLVVSSRWLSPDERAKMPEHMRRLIIHEASDTMSRLRSLTTAHPRILGAVRSFARHRSMGSGEGSDPFSTPEGTGRIELPLELHIARQLGKTIEALAEEHNPDLIHALRVRFEGISLASIAAKWPTAISIWGQDLARQAPATKKLAIATRLSLADLHGLHADCHRGSSRFVVNGPTE